MPPMQWSPLATQFCLQLSFGVLAALAFVPRAPVGVLFYRVMGTAALVPLLAAALLPALVDGAPWTDAPTLLAGLALVGYPLFSGPVRGARWALALALALVGSASALVVQLARGALVEGPLALVMASFSALSTGAVAGSIGLAMVLGHWYLTVPNLAVRHLQRLNRVTVVCLAASLSALVGSCLVFGASLSDAQPPLLGAWGLFYLGTRIAVGLLLPMLFAWMVSSSLAYRNTRSATGILYASTVLVLIGTAVSVSLTDSYGVPL
jgi:hypothetical protein